MSIYFGHNIEKGAGGSKVCAKNHYFGILSQHFWKWLSEPHSVGQVLLMDKY